MTRVLLVDDEPEILLCLSTALRHRGYLVAECDQVSDALHMLPEVDCVITDGLDGQCWPILLRARELGVRVVLYTGSPWLAQEAEREGFVAMVKPGSLETLLAMVAPQEVAK